MSANNHDDMPILIMLVMVVIATFALYSTGDPLLAILFSINTILIQMVFLYLEVTKLNI